MPNDDTFAIRLLRAKSAEGLSLAQLSRDSGVSHTSISQYVSGEKGNPKMDTLVRLAKSLRVSVDYLCGLEDKNT